MATGASVLIAARLFAVAAENVTIEGTGTIDGQGLPLPLAARRQEHDRQV